MPQLWRGAVLTPHISFGALDDTAALIFYGAYTILPVRVITSLCSDGFLLFPFKRLWCICRHHRNLQGSRGTRQPATTCKPAQPFQTCLLLTHCHFATRAAYEARCCCSRAKTLGKRGRALPTNLDESSVADDTPGQRGVVHAARLRVLLGYWEDDLECRTSKTKKRAYTHIHVSVAFLGALWGAIARCLWGHSLGHSCTALPAYRRRRYVSRVDAVCRCTRYSPR